MSIGLCCTKDPAKSAMGTIEEKSKNCKNHRKDEEDKPTPIFPTEVIMEILSWLPLKYLSQVQLVCKEWKAFIHDHYFTEKHLGRYTDVDPWYNNLVGKDFQFPPNSYCFIHGCDGVLLCRSHVSQKYSIWNPAIDRVLELPDPHHPSRGLAFVFVPSTKNYRIVSICKYKESGSQGCEVLTPGPSMSWRHLSFPDGYEITKKDIVSVVPAGGAVHSVRYTKAGNETVVDIITLDVETECFTVNRLPSVLFCDKKNVRELDWDGKLAFADVVGQSLQLIELEDYKKQKWSEKQKTVDLPFMKEGNVTPLLNTEGNAWFWIEKKKLVACAIKTGKITYSTEMENFSLTYKLYPYKPSLVAFEGMEPETSVDSD